MKRHNFEKQTKDSYRWNENRSKETKPKFNYREQFRNKQPQSYDSAPRNTNIICYNCNEMGHKSHECQSKARGLRCFKCSNFGHKSIDCGKNVFKIKSYANDDKIKKKITVMGYEINALFDSGSEITMIKESIYEKLSKPELKNDHIILNGIGNDEVIPLGYFNAEISIDNCVITSDIYVLKELPEDAIIGMNVMKHFNFILDENGMRVTSERKKSYVGIVRICRKLAKVTEAEDSSLHKIDKTSSESERLFRIRDAISENEIDSCYNLHSGLKAEIANLTTNYQQNKIKSTELKMLAELRKENRLLKEEVGKSRENNIALFQEKIWSYQEKLKQAKKKNIAYAKVQVENEQLKSKLAQWYKYTNELQRAINSTYHRSIDTTPFELLFGTKMNVNGLEKFREMIEFEFQENFEAQREELRKHAKQQIFKVQQENRKTYNAKRREAQKYEVGDFVAVKRTQFGPHLKLRAKYFGPYKITKIKGGNTYDVVKEGYHEGPNCTTTCAEFLKKWTAS